MTTSTKALCRPKEPGVVVCMPYCKSENLYLWNAELKQGQTAHVTFHYRCIKCGANHLAQLDEYFIATALIQGKRLGNNENPASCPL